MVTTILTLEMERVKKLRSNMTLRLSSKLRSNDCFKRELFFITEIEIAKNYTFSSDTDLKVKGQGHFKVKRLFKQKLIRYYRNRGQYYILPFNENGEPIVFHLTIANLSKERCFFRMPFLVGFVM